MTVLEQMLAKNKAFVDSTSLIYEQIGSYVGKVPKRKLAVFTCMDTRLVEFLEPALGLRREDAVVIKNAGNSVTGPFEATIRSLVIAIYELGVQEIIVIGHEDCGVAHSSAGTVINKMLDRGISPDAIKMIKDELTVWLDTFHHPHDNVRQVVGRIRNNPLIPADVPIHGLIFEPHTGEVSVLLNGY
ncbi:beta-class carbonic anhydrase [Sporomusa termitida]|uniref:carbonic anhydrase n=1 Tax=Sporomusa termitida TaxID=2377 RepID=A0A517DY38_9FIRM|nr:carbonic anhydrase [Sporomusa termitida]QDR82269.1 Beta-carbonic anhydrase 1 [Sporomusa termitida]